MMPQISPVGKIRYPHDIFKYVESPLTGSMWAVSTNGSRWFRPYGIITTPPNSSPFHAKTSLYTEEGDIMITFFPSVNGGGHFVGVDGGWLSCRIVQIQYTASDGI